MSETVKNANGEKNIRKAAWRLCATFQATENYEREGAYDFLYCILPFIAETYKDSPDELKYRLKKNNEFFNCNPVFSGPIIGLIAAMEENHVNEDTIQAIKVGLMGPLAGLGDTIIYTEREHFYSRKRLYEVLEVLGAGFMQISKQCVIRLNRVKTVEAGFSGTLLLKLTNGLSDYVSRKYLPDFKNYLGL